MLRLIGACVQLGLLLARLEAVPFHAHPRMRRCCAPWARESSSLLTPDLRPGLRCAASENAGVALGAPSASLGISAAGSDAR